MIFNKNILLQTPSNPSSFFVAIVPTEESSACDNVMLDCILKNDTKVIHSALKSLNFHMWCYWRETILTSLSLSLNFWKLLFWFPFVFGDCSEVLTIIVHKHYRHKSFFLLEKLVQWSGCYTSTWPDDHYPTDFNVRQSAQHIPSNTISCKQAPCWSK